MKNNLWRLKGRKGKTKVLSVFEHLTEVQEKQEEASKKAKERIAKINAYLALLRNHVKG